MPIPVSLVDLRADAQMQIQQKLAEVSQSARNLADLTRGQYLESDGALMYALNNIQRELSDAVAAARILAFLRYCREESNNDNQDQ
ncbi:hypothetical protein UFOVP365_34 [uncultured Caudovirales phage]|uniref:Uncharacterized protein n=1 Tax=uncultured Caudovirales phage TaxID=2100421 RepID=A0A6J7X1A8_9CAUD|nr:hypothetical protein UFOVP365_34 [uncultured Caudovirales phage]